MTKFNTSNEALENALEIDAAFNVTKTKIDYIDGEI